MPRPTTTLLLITRDRLCRADCVVGRGVRVTSFHARPRPVEIDSLAAAVDSLVVSGKLGKRVWVLTSDVWTQTLHMSHGRTSGISESELSSALAFEAEAMSGISAFESAVGYRRVTGESGQQTYWVTQSTHGEVEQVEQIVGRMGGRLQGLLHPGGLPQHVAHDGGKVKRGAAWRRVELWPDAVVCASADAGAAGDSADVRVINADPSSTHWEAEVEDWQQGSAVAGHASVLLGCDSVSHTPTADTVLDLRQDEDVSSWLTAWAEHLHDAPTAPSIAPPPKQLSTQSRVVIAACLAAGCLVGCLALQMAMTATNERLDRQLTDLKAPADQIKAFKKQADAARKQSADLKSQADALEEKLHAFEDAIGVQRTRYVALLKALAAHRPNDLVVDQIEDAQGAVKMTGSCLTPELANRLAEALQDGLADDGWSVTPATKRANLTTSNGGPWSFELTIRPARVRLNSNGGVRVSTSRVPSVAARSGEGEQ